MGKRLQFERIPLKAVPQPPEVKEKPDKNGDGNRAETAKGAAAAAAGSKSEQDDRATGLWIDREVLNRHHNRLPRVVLHDAMPSVNNRYLTLADLAFKNHRGKSPQRPGERQPE